MSRILDHIIRRSVLVILFDQRVIVVGRFKILENLAIVMSVDKVDYVASTNVSLIFFNETISLPDLLNFKSKLTTDDTNNKENSPPSAMLKIEKSKMNRSVEHNYCIGIKYPIPDHNIKATLKVYAAKIEIKGVRPLSTLKDLVCNLLDSLEIDYNVKCNKFLDITLLSLGKIRTVARLEKIVTKLVEKSELIFKNKKIVFKKSFLHITGVKDESYFKLVRDKFLRDFSATAVAPRLTVREMYSVMSNATYDLGYNINIWKLTSLITTVPGFDKGRSFCIYNNLLSAHYVLVVLKIDLSEEDENSLWRYNIETTFTIKNKGTITQSSPSQAIGLKSFHLFIEAMKLLENKVKREPDMIED
jgi:hypothetical protein